MGDYILEIDEETDTVLVGEITERSQFYINVKLISPFYGFENSRSINGHARNCKMHYLTERGDEIAKEILINSFKLMQEIDSTLNRLADLNCIVKQETDKISCCGNKIILERIMEKMDDWFYKDFLPEKYTGDSAYYYKSEKEQVDQIFETFRLTGKKIYMPLD